MRCEGCDGTGGPSKSCAGCGGTGEALLACSTKDRPGGDACGLPRGHAGLHDWQGGRPVAGHRHVADLLGHSVYSGDQVVAMVSYASGSSTRRSALVVGHVTEILPAHVTVACDVPMGDIRPGRGGCMVAKTLRVRDCHLVKVTARRP